MTRRKKLALRIAGALVALGLAAAIVVVLIVQSPWFHEQVRRRIVTEVENATGGKVVIAAFSFHWPAMRAEVRDFTVRGLEAEGEQPLFHADSVAVGLKIISALRRDIDIGSLSMRAPKVNVIVDAQGRTNIPEPKVARRSTRPVEQFLRLAVGELRITEGQFRYRSQVTPLDVAGEQVFVRLLYERAGPGYRGDVEARRLRVAEPLAVPLALDLGVSLHLRRDRLQLDSLRLGSGASRVTATATVESFERPRATAKFEGTGAMNELVPVFRIPLRREGTARFSGTLEYAGPQAWRADGSVAANGLGLDRAWLHLRGARAETAFHIEPQRVDLSKLAVFALGGRFDGRASVANWDRYDVSGRAAGFDLQGLKETASGWSEALRRLAWSGEVSGPFAVAGSLRDTRNLRLTTDLSITPGERGVPLSGLVAMEYDYRANHLVFRDSKLEMPSSRVHFNGTLETGIEFGVFSRNLDDFLPALALFTEQPPAALPARLVQGPAKFEGKLTGTVRDPAVAGRLETGPVAVAGRTFGHLTADLEASAAQLRVTRLAADQGTLRLDGFATIGLDRWRVTGSSAITGQASLRQGRIEQLLADNRVDIPLRGAISGFVDARGTIDTPRGSGAFTITGLEAYEEKLDRVDGEFRLSPTLLEVSSLRARAGAATLEAAGSYERGDENWRSGGVRFEVTSRGMKLAPWQAVARFQPNLDATVAGKLTGSARLNAGRAELTGLDGDLRVSEIAVSGRELGDATLSSRTSGRLVTVLLAGAFGESKVNGRAEWSLTANSFGLGQIQVSNLTFVAMQNLGLFGDPSRELPFRGGLDGEIGFSGPILHPQNWTGAAKITRLAVEPVARGVIRKQDVERLTLRNREPLLAYLDTRGLHLQQARLVAEGTDLEASGTVGFRGRTAWNLQLRGSLNLPVLGMLDPDLLADGRSTIDALIRGNLSNPQITGRADLVNASFYARDVPNGIDRANGTIRFDRTRATIEKLTAVTGGGDLDLSGFVGFGGDELVYRLQAAARRVRVRYPEAVSTTFDAALSLTGTTSRRLLSGAVTVNRVGITPRTDIGSLLAETGRSVTPTTVPNPFLRGMQLDVAVQTSPDAEFQTSLTRDIQPEAELRLRGTAARPVVLGRVSVNQGEIQFFGTQYTITRGDVSFFNPVKIEPVLSLDLETRVRGITVTINFTGPIDKLNVSYRSDPPLQSNEIIALLTVGRAPGSEVTGTSTTNPSQSFLTAGSNSLLGQAVAAPISGRLQRLFGVSRLKIDPELTGITNTPQARLTVEQQLSREISITYITNLNRTQQQVVRLQWDFSKDFSLLAVRDENGIFGVDFLYRRRFK